MLSNPKPNQIVRVWYAKQYRETMPYHGWVGTVEVVCKAKPRNHGVRMMAGAGQSAARELVAIPAGNLRTLVRHFDHLIDVRRADKGWVAATVGTKITYLPGRQVLDLAGNWHTVMGVHQTRDAATDAAKTAIETRLMGMEPIGELIDYRDRRRKLAWHEEAAERRDAAERNSTIG